MKFEDTGIAKKIKTALDEGEMLACVVLDSIAPWDTQAYVIAKDSLRKIQEAKELIR